MPETETELTLKGTIKQSTKNLQRFIIGPAGSEVAAILVMMVLIGLVAAPVASFADNKVSANGQAPSNPCAGQIIANSTTQVSGQLQISGATNGADKSLSIFTGRDGGVVERVSEPLGVENGTLPPNLCLGTTVSDLVRPDGEAIPPSQVTSWAVTGNAGLRVFIHIRVSPRYGVVTPSGGYAGTVSMSDERATGGNVPVVVHVEYPRLWRASMVCLVAAWCGFFWAWLIHLTRADIPSAGRFWLYVILQFAILTIVTFPVLNAQILTNPDWPGDVSHYIALASLAGGGALATTPTLRALVDRAAIFMPGASPGYTPGGLQGASPAASSASSTDSTDMSAAAAPQAAPADGASDTSGDSAPAAADTSGDSPAVPTGTNGDSTAAPAGTNGDSPAVPAGTNGGSSSASSVPDDASASGPSAPPGADDGTTSAPSTSGATAGPDDGSTGTPSTPPGGPDDGSTSAPSAPAVPAGAPVTPTIPIPPSEN